MEGRSRRKCKILPGKQPFPACVTGGGGGLKSREGRERVRERVGGGLACVFPRHASSCETMIYAFLRTLGSENVTFNQVH